MLNREDKGIGLSLAYIPIRVMLLIFKDIKSYLRSFISVIPRLDRGIQKKELDYPVKPDNDNHWNRVRYE
jgi:hypothetical protein